MQKDVAKLVQLVNESGCFDLQFRKDTRSERTNSPTYYRWKVQFIITVPKSEKRALEQAQKLLKCGTISQTGQQARLSVQNIDQIQEMVISFFSKHPLSHNKRKDFELWRRAVDVVHQNKRKPIIAWKKSDLLSLIEIHKASAKYKQKPKEAKWIGLALTLVKNLKNESA